jgi:hypothetical protein
MCAHIYRVLFVRLQLQICGQVRWIILQKNCIYTNLGLEIYWSNNVSSMSFACTFKALSQNCEESLLASWCLSVCLSIRHMEQLGFHFPDFHEICLFVCFFHGRPRQDTDVPQPSWLFVPPALDVPTLATRCPRAYRRVPHSSGGSWNLWAGNEDR